MYRCSMTEIETDQNPNTGTTIQGRGHRPLDGDNSLSIITLTAEWSCRQVTKVNLNDSRADGPSPGTVTGPGLAG